MKNIRLQMAGAATWILFVWFALCLPSAVLAQTTFGNSGCTACHAATGARITGANSAAVLIAANASHAMGVNFAVVNANLVAADLGAIFAGQLSQINAVNYRSIGNVIPITSLVIDNPGAVVTTTALVGANGGATQGTVAAGTPNSLNITYNHTATNCTSDSITVIGAGLANTANRTVTVNINPPPAPTASSTNPAAANWNTNTPIAVNVANSATSFPSSISVTTGTNNGGTATPVGTTSITYRSSTTNYFPVETFSYRVNGPTGCGTQSGIVNMTVNVALPVPAITSANIANGNGGQAFNHQLTASNMPANVATSFAVTGALPNGVTLNTATGLFSGIPTQTGVFPVQVTATNPTGTSVAQNLTITITLVAPVITSANVANGVGGQPFNYTITANNLPTSYSVTGTLPMGLNVDTTTGVISGVPTQLGAFPVTINATNAAGTGSQPLTITISSVPPVITSANAASGNGGQPFSYQIIASNLPTSYSVTGVLPNGVSIDTATGLISGTPTQTGAFNVTINATNGAGTGSQALAITITLVAPVITSANSANGIGAQAFNYTITAGNLPASYSVTGTLPTGLSVNTVTGAITGIPTVTGSFPVTVNATNAAGTGSQALTINIALAAPVITSANVANGNGGQPFSYTITAGNLPTSYSVTGALPAGLSVNSATGVISGTPSLNGVFNVTVNATNAAGTGGQALTINLNAIAPVITSANTASGQAGVPFSYTITANNVPTSFNATGLPPGVSIDMATGAITGTPTANGTFPGTISATNAAGTANQGFTITIAVAALPTATNVNMTVPLNTATTLDLAPSITGFAVTGIRIVTAPAMGSATVNGTRVTYAPRTDYFGADSFTYSAFNQGGESSPATVTVIVEGRPDPTKQANVVGTVSAQVQAAQRFARAQISNFGRHLEGLHRGGRAASATPPHSHASAAAAPKFVDPFSEVPRTDAAVSAGNRSSDVAVARPVQDYARGTASPNDAGRAAFGAPALGVPGNGVEGRLPAVAHVASATPTEATLTDASNALLRVNGAGLAADLVSALASRSFNLAQLSASGGAGAQPSNAIGGTDFWIEGSVNWGNRDTTGGSSLDFTTQGISFGVDWRLSEQLVVGVGAGFARDKTAIGTDGTKSEAKGASLAVYGSYQPSANTFVDAIVGAGTLNFDNERFVAPIGAVAKSDRDGTQIFASLAGGYEFRRGSILLSPYGRLDLSYDRLKDSTETGVGQFALHYFGENMRSTQGALGLRFESAHATRFGWIAPRARIEYRHSFTGDHVSQIAYADLIAGQRYSIATTAVERDALVAGIGADFYLRNGLALGIEYQLQKDFPAGSGSSQGLRLRLTQALDGKGVRRPPVARVVEGAGAPHHDSSDIRVDLGMTYDDNVSRGRIGSEVLSDSSVNFAVNRVELFPFTDNTRLMLVGSVGGDKFDTYNGLDRVFAALRGELQYRASGDFGSPVWALFGRLAGEQFESQLRRGYRASIGVSVRAPITDRILLFGALAHNERYAKSDVFDTRDNSLQLNLDYAPNRDSTFYVSGEYRDGEFVSSGLGSLANIDIAKVFARDDAFTAPQMFAYKTDATARIVTLGYNLSFGERDSLDFSWRWARATPDSRPSFNAPGPWHYDVNQYSVVYLLRF